MKIDKQKLDELVQQKYVSVQKHPECDLWIYNYTQKAQFDRYWTPETMMCRGLILDVRDEIVAWPFNKFFNVAEHEAEDKQDIPDEPFTVWDKLDGSLGILYHMPDGTPRLATRGSFMSDQAIEGTKILRELLSRHPGFFMFDPNYTFMFEIIYPQNRIVVDYKGERKLVYLGARRLSDGALFAPHAMSIPNPFEIAGHFKPEDMARVRDNAEGFVLHYKSGFMVKVKYEEYVRLHRLVTGVTARRIWDLLRNNESLDELLDRVPDEFYAWVKKTTKKLELDFKELKREMIADYLKIATEITFKYDDGTAQLDGVKAHRREFAELAKKTKYPSIMFLLLDDRDIDDSIWKLLRPAHEVPFTTEI